MNELFLQAGTVGIIAAISYKSLDLASEAVKKKIDGKNGNGAGVIGELRRLNEQLSKFLSEHAHHLEVSKQICGLVKDNKTAIDRVSRDVLLMKREERE